MPGIGVIFLALISITSKASYDAVQEAQAATGIARSAVEEVIDVQSSLAVHMAAQVECDKNIEVTLCDIKIKLVSIDDRLLEQRIMLEKISTQKTIDTTFTKQ